MMKLLLSSLLLTSLCGRSCWSVSLGTLVVIQTPDVSVTEGETADITCCWTEKFERATVQWLKTETIIKNDRWWKKVQVSLKKDANNCSSLSFPNITKDVSGRYICKVLTEVPLHISANGKGTSITVIALESKDYDSDDCDTDDAPLAEVYIYILRCLLILILVSPLCCLFCYLRTKALRNTPASARYNPRSVRRPEEDEDEGEGDERVIH